MNRRPVVALVMALVAAAAHAQSDWVDRILAGYRDRTSIETDAGLGSEAAVEVQRRVVEALRSDHGDVFGYKAGLTSAAAQERFNVDEPILGTLLSAMILDNGARISLADGVQLLVEADLMVRVADPRINDATTPAEAFHAIDRAAAFVEVPDVIIDSGQPVTGPVLTAVNSGARFGVMGPSVGTGNLAMTDLAGFTVRLYRNGAPAGPESSGRALLGDPLNVVLWIVGETQRRGVTLQAGDWLSLGSLTPPSRAQAGDRYRARFEGLGPEPLEVTVEFVP